MDTDKPSAACAATTVAQIYNLLYRGFATRRTTERKSAPGSLSRLADSKSAIQQSVTLRHARGIKPQVRYLPPLREPSSLHHGLPVCKQNAKTQRIAKYLFCLCTSPRSLNLRVNLESLSPVFYPCPSESIRS